MHCESPAASPPFPFLPSVPASASIHAIPGLFIQPAAGAKNFFENVVFEPVWRGKLFQMKVFGAAIDSVKFSSKSELSSRFFGRLKFFALFEYLGLLNFGQKYLDMALRSRTASAAYDAVTAKAVIDT